MDHYLADLNMDDPNLDVCTSEFSHSQPQYVMKIPDITRPVPIIQMKQEHLLMQNKDQIHGQKLLQMGCASDLGRGINGGLNYSLGNISFLTHEALVNEAGLSHDNGIQVSLDAPEEDMQQNGSYGTRELVVNEQDFLDQGNKGNTDPMSLNDPGMAAALELIKSAGISEDPEFSPLPSSKKRNPPYLIKGDSKIATKNGEPVRFCLSGAKVCQLVKISLRFSEEKFKNTPVYACPLHNSEGDNGKCNFAVSTKVDDQCRYDSILGHYTASLKLCVNNFDIKEDFTFSVIFKCLNSCHKENGKKMELILTLMDMDGTLLKESRFEIRACKNVKRDYKEAFQDDEDAVVENQMHPDAFITAEYPQPSYAQPSSSASEEVKPVKIKGKTVKVQMIHPAEEREAKRIKREPHPGKPMQCVPAPAPEKYSQKFYLIKLPDSTKEKLALGVIKEFGGEIFNIESVVPAAVNVEDDYDEA